MTLRSPTTMSASPATIGATSVGDVVGRVLVVGVGVDDDVGAELEAGVETGLEGEGQALVVGELHDVVDAERPSHLDRAVGGAVVDDQPLDRVEARAPRGAGPASEIGSWSSSLRHGIWMMSFMAERDRTVPPLRRERVVDQRPEPLAEGVDGELPGARLGALATSARAGAGRR